MKLLAIGAALLVVAGLVGYAGQSRRAPAMGVDPDLAEAVERNTRVIAELAVEISGLRARLEKSAPGRLAQGPPLDRGPTGEHLEALAERIDSLERALDDLAVGRSVGQYSAAEMRESLATQLHRGPADTYRPNRSGEALFEADEGTPLGDRAEGLADTLHAADDLIQLQDLHCGESVCKIVYTPLPGQETGGKLGDLELGERIAEGLGGVDFTTRHARDANGNLVMYLQLSPM